MEGVVPRCFCLSFLSIITTVNNMSERNHDYLRNEWPARHIFFYGDRINDEHATPADRYVALEHLVATELGVGETEAQFALQSRDFLTRIRDIRQSGLIDSERMEHEIYAMAPLLILWTDIKDTRSSTDAKQWLDMAIKVALSAVEGHGDTGCATDTIHTDMDCGCDRSPLCPARTVALLLISPALRPQEETGIHSESPEATLGMLQYQIMSAAEQGLLTQPQAEEVMNRYNIQRRQSTLPEDFTE